jgi:hypothetical protein
MVLTSVTDPEGGPHRWIAWTFGIASRYLDRSRMQPRLGVVAALNRVIGDGGEGVERARRERERCSVGGVGSARPFGPIASAFERDRLGGGDAGGAAEDLGEQLEQGCQFGAGELGEQGLLDSSDAG